ncbi:hypothetical protein L6R46_04485 [Myxococcota bacterium]|jgi:uncharacterized protein (UPF0332 family)|nr:hypothetical protein [Myxococcota bacterium]
MSLHDDLLKQAQQLARSEPKRPKQASLRRAVSAAYYALFHLLVHEGSVALSPLASPKVRSIVARTYQHADMKKVAAQVSKKNLPKPYQSLGLSLAPELVDVAKTFTELQDARHSADYDVRAQLQRRAVLDLVAQAEEAFRCWKLCRRTEAAQVFLMAMLLKGRD